MADTTLGAEAPITEQIKQQTQQTVNLLRDQLKQQLSQRKDQVAVAVTDVGQWLKQSGAQLQSQGYGLVATPYLESAATRVTEFGQQIQERDIEEIVSQTEVFARVQPVIFLTSAAVVGFVAARFLRSSNVQVV